MVALKADACDCPNGYCREFCEPVTECVNRVARLGEVKTKWCEVHISYTWHLNGRCLKCEAMKTDTQDVNSLIAILAKIREALGVGHKPMLSELPDEARKVRERADLNTIVVGRYCIYRRDKSLWLRHDSGEAIEMNSANEKKFEQLIAKLFKANI